MAIIYIGLGTNIGDRAANCRKAVELLSEKGVKPLRQSSYYETEPWGKLDQPPFINAVLEADTALSPKELLEAVKGVEQEMGRTTVERWGPRVIDLDILLYDGLQLDEEGLVLPHPLMHARAFVLVPLNEIAPELAHPVFGKTISELLSRLDTSGVRKYER